MKDEVVVLGSPSLIILMVSVDVKRHLKKKKKKVGESLWKRLSKEESLELGFEPFC